ncbi:MAG: DEDD exonuclease domain-containing protein, partial [Acidimicrobiia bacterium]
DLGTPLFHVPFCIVDLETTGGSPASCGITEIGAVRFRGGEQEGAFHSMVNPGAPIPPFITVLTGITHAMVLEAPPMEAVLPAFLEFLGEAVIVGHNVRFDLGFLAAAAERLDYRRLPNRTIDTVALARRLVRDEVRNLQLQTLAVHFRSPVIPVHRALEDARATAHVFHALLERAGTIGVTALEDLLQLPTARGSAHFAKLRLADQLPRRPGVYLFLDRRDDVIYVGKAKNLRTRVRSYFYGDERRSIGAILRELHRVDFRVCETELEASVTELRLIGAHRPRHNRRSRPPRSSHWLKLTRERFPRLSTTRTFHDDGIAHLGPFRSRRSAGLVMTAIWDALPIRRCTGRPGGREGPCAPAQLGVAFCPCDGRLPEPAYREVIDRLVAGLDDDPSLLLDALATRMGELAASRRFEEAAWVRDRHRALALAIERRRAWQAMQRAGLVELESCAGDRALVDRGRLVAAWGSGAHPTLWAVDPPDDPWPSVAPSVAAAEEAQLVWRWMTSGMVRLVAASGPLGLPARPVPGLRPVG